MNESKIPNSFRVFLEFAITGLSAALLGWLLVRILPSWAQDFAEIIQYGVILLGLGFIYLVRYRALTKQARLLSLLAALSLVFLFGLVTYYRLALAEQRTIYFLIDTSRQTQSDLEEIKPHIKRRALEVPNSNEIGLASYGSNVEREATCDDVQQLVPPAPYSEMAGRFESAVDSLGDPLSVGGQAGLQESVSSAILELKGRRGIQQILVITSGLDTSCSPLDRSKLESIANESAIEIELTILTVGEIETSEMSVLEVFADRYRHSGNVQELSTFIDLLIPPPPPDLDCKDIPYRSFKVSPSDPHRFDPDKDGIGCETG